MASAQPLRHVAVGQLQLPIRENLPEDPHALSFNAKKHYFQELLRHREESEPGSQPVSARIPKVAKVPEYLLSPRAIAKIPQDTSVLQPFPEPSPSEAISSDGIDTNSSYADSGCKFTDDENTIPRRFGRFSDDLKHSSMLEDHGTCEPLANLASAAPPSSPHEASFCHSFSMQSESLAQPASCLQVSAHRTYPISEVPSLSTSTESPVSLMDAKSLSLACDGGDNVSSGDSTSTDARALLPSGEHPPRSDPGSERHSPLCAAKDWAYVAVLNDGVLGFHAPPSLEEDADQESQTCPSDQQRSLSAILEIGADAPPGWSTVEHAEVDHPALQPPPSPWPSGRKVRCEEEGATIPQKWRAPVRVRPPVTATRCEQSPIRENAAPWWRRQQPKSHMAACHEKGFASPVMGFRTPAMSYSSPHLEYRSPVKPVVFVETPLYPFSTPRQTQVAPVQHTVYPAIIRKPQVSPLASPVLSATAISGPSRSPPARQPPGIILVDDFVMKGRQSPPFSPSPSSPALECHQWLGTSCRYQRDMVDEASSRLKQVSPRPTTRRPRLYGCPAMYGGA